ncbi:hypothetical protein GOBAR_AA37004 [Gossypium barbadense]|uniref:Endonuclease/exonuclease/phosphatase domain-containing protein n=1 Tax=Gossypium barbadense TaxID=3634 RepID=A0A2P5VXY5_GOSBA|nr:hypothetical protein GOBAR_AA37004 [Gossypium barbadense]
MLLWDAAIQIDVICASNQVIHVHCKEQGSMKSTYLTVVYASPNTSKRKLLWPKLSRLVLDSSKAWVLGGDFNSILSQNERVGGALNRCGIMGFRVPRNYGVSLGKVGLGS